MMSRNFVPFLSMVPLKIKDDPKKGPKPKVEATQNKRWTKPKVEATQKSLTESLEESIKACGGKIPTHIYPKGEKTLHAEEIMQLRDVEVGNQGQFCPPVQGTLYSHPNIFEDYFSGVISRVPLDAISGD